MIAYEILGSPQFDKLSSLVQRMAYGNPNVEDLRALAVQAFCAIVEQRSTIEDLRREVERLKRLSPYCDRKDCVYMTGREMCNGSFTAKERLSRSCYKKKGR